MGTLDKTPQWHLMATIEVDEAYGDRIVLAPREGPRYQLSPCERSPKGFVWYDVFVDGTHGEARAARDVRAVLGMLEQFASDVLHTSLRIVSGKEWLSGESHQRGVSLSPGNEGDREHPSMS